jgi:uncharacterized membrane protein YbhN (UPF0104 family)
MAERARRGRAAARWLLTLAALVAIVWLVDPRAVGTRLQQLELRWMVAFVALSLPLYLLYAWRWSFTAARLGAPLSFRRAYLDYYVSTLLNQTLPLGVAGDVVRGVRHQRRLRRDDAAAAPAGPAATAIVLERLSGLAALGLFVAASAVIWLLRGRGQFVSLGAGALLAIAVAGALAARLLRRFHGAGVAALWARGALALQLLISTAAVAILLLLFTCAARAAGAPLDPVLALQVVPLVLLATALPWAFGGWGAREATVAALYRLVGLDAATGVAVSIAFGLLSLLAATPGLIVLVLPEARSASS